MDIKETMKEVMYIMETMEKHDYWGEFVNTPKELDLAMKLHQLNSCKKISESLSVISNHLENIARSDRKIKKSQQDFLVIFNKKMESVSDNFDNIEITVSKFADTVKAHLENII